MNMPENIEVYIKGNDPAPLLAFLEQNIGSLTFGSEIVTGHHQYNCGEIKVFINENIAGDYISVYLVGTNNWSSDIELARDIAKQLHLVVRCDPGDAYPDVSPHSSTFVEIRREGEHLVAWD